MTSILSLFKKPGVAPLIEVPNGIAVPNPLKRFAAAIAEPKEAPARSYTFEKLPCAQKHSNSSFSKDVEALSRMGKEEILALPFMKEFKPLLEAFKFAGENDIEAARNDILRFLCDKENLYQFLLLLNYDSGSAFAGVEVRNCLGYTEVHEGKLKFLNFSECCCDLEHRRPKRAGIEREILSSIHKQFKDRKTSAKDPLRYASIGSNNGLQDWILLSHLVALGFTHVEVHLCDLVYKNKATLERLSKMQDFFRQIPGIHYQFHFHPSMEEFAAQKIPCDVLLALDFDVKPNPDQVPVEIEMSKLKAIAVYDKNKPDCQLGRFRSWKNIGLQTL